MDNNKLDQLEFTIAEKIEDLVMRGMNGELLHEDEKISGRFMDFNGVVRGACEGLATEIIELIKNLSAANDGDTTPQQQPPTNNNKTTAWCPICACEHPTGQHLFGSFER